MLNNFLFVHAIGLYLSIHSYNCSFIYFTLIVEEMTLSLRYKYQNNNKEDLISTSKINIASSRSLEIFSNFWKIHNYLQVYIFAMINILGILWNPIFVKM